MAMAMVMENVVIVHWKKGESRYDIRARIRICAWVYAYAFAPGTLPMPTSREAHADGVSLLFQG